MKKLLTVAALLGVATWTFGQGFVNFNNTTTTKVSANGATLTTATAGAWYYALLTAPSTQNTIDPSLTGWTFVGLGTNTALVGRMSSAFAPDALGSPVAGTTTTGTADFAIVAWSGNLGPTFSNVFEGRPLTLAQQPAGQGTATWHIGAETGGFYGISAVANDVPLAASGGPYNNTWGLASGQRIQGMNLNFYVVPEPSTFALAGLGAAALLIFRRRK